VKKPKLIYYDILKYHPEVLSMMKESFEVFSLPDPRHDGDDVLENSDVILAPMGFIFGRDKIKKCPKLKIIGSSTLSVPHIDVKYCNSKGIKVIYLEDEKEFLNTITPTAELTWGLIISVIRRIPWAHKAACSGHWGGRAFGRVTPRMLSNMTLGIVGLGRLGSMVAKRGKPLVKEICYYSPNSTNPEYVKCSSLTELAGTSDIVSIHAHHTPETEGLLGESFIQAVRQGSYLINTARGPIIDEKALLTALESGHLGGAALDVLADEYRPDFKATLKDNPLVRYAIDHDNLIITPHYAGATVDAWAKTQSKTLELILKEIGE